MEAQSRADARGASRAHASVSERQAPEEDVSVDDSSPLSSIDPSIFDSSIDPSPLTSSSPTSPLSASLSAFTLVAPRIVAATLRASMSAAVRSTARASAFAKDAVTNVARMFAPTPPNARHISAAPLASTRTVSRSVAMNAARHAFASKTSNARRCAFRSFASAPRVEAQCRASNPLAEVESADASRG